MRNQSGFTLVELMVVIAIIGIITAIAIPYYNNYKKTACDQAALADLYNIKAAVQKYLTDETLKGTAVATDVAAALAAVKASGDAGDGKYGYPGPTKKCGVQIAVSGTVATATAASGTDFGRDTGWKLDMAGGGDPVAGGSGGGGGSSPTDTTTSGGDTPSAGGDTGGGGGGGNPNAPGQIYQDTGVKPPDQDNRPGKGKDK